MNELKLYQERKDLWAVLLFFKHTKGSSRWIPVRKLLRQELTPEEDEMIREIWAEANDEGRI